MCVEIRKPRLQPCDSCSNHLALCIYIHISIRVDRATVQLYAFKSRFSFLLFVHANSDLCRAARSSALVTVVTTVRAILLRIAVSRSTADLARTARPPSINRRRVRNAETTLNKKRQLRGKPQRTMPSSSDARNRKHEQASAKTKIA